MSFLLIAIFFLSLSSSAYANCIVSNSNFSGFVVTINYLYGVFFLVAGGIQLKRSKVDKNYKGILFLAIGIIFTILPFIIPNMAMNFKANSIKTLQGYILDCGAIFVFSLICMMIFLLKKTRSIAASLFLLPITIVYLGQINSARHKIDTTPICCQLPKIQIVDDGMTDAVCPELCFPCDRQGKKLESAPLESHMPPIELVPRYKKR